MHRQFRQKIAYDLLRFKTKGVNWVCELSLYEAILNEDPKEELGWKSPFEIYYGRKSNRVVCPLLDNSLPVPTETITAADDVNIIILTIYHPHHHHRYHHHHYHRH